MSRHALYYNYAIAHESEKHFTLLLRQHQMVPVGDFWLGLYQSPDELLYATLTNTFKLPCLLTIKVESHM